MWNFRSIIYSWYDEFRRDLPWRNTTDPYKIWISEVILQQTRVAQGMDYYKRFIREFPHVKKLASAPESKVLKLWQGLGYYSRARNLHTASKTISNQYNGNFPDDYESILSLKGIGTYTASAIASIAFNLPYAVVDGNIYRLLSRYMGITTPVDTEKGKREFQQIAGDLLHEDNPGFHNQALMEFGALQCTPKSPQCTECPLLDSCYAAANNLVGELPVKIRRTKQRNRYLHFFFMEHDNCIYLEKRIQNDIWKNLYQFPLWESEGSLSDEELLKCRFLQSLKDISAILEVSPVKKHVLSHQIIHARFVHLRLKDQKYVNSHSIRVKKKDISKFAVPRLIEQYLIDKLG